MRRSRQAAHGSAPRRGGAATPGGLGSKALFHKGCAPSGSAAVAIVDWPEPACSTWQPQLRSISTASPPGSERCHGPPLAPRASPRSPLEPTSPTVSGRLSDRSQRFLPCYMSHMQRRRVRRCFRDWRGCIGEEPPRRFPYLLQAETELRREGRVDPASLTADALIEAASPIGIGTVDFRMVPRRVDHVVASDRQADQLHAMLPGDLDPPVVPWSRLYGSRWRGRDIGLDPRNRARSANAVELAVEEPWVRHDRGAQGPEIGRETGDDQATDMARTDSGAGRLDEVHIDPIVGVEEHEQPAAALEDEPADRMLLPTAVQVVRPDRLRGQSASRNWTRPSANGRSGRSCPAMTIRKSWSVCARTEAKVRLSSAVASGQSWADARAMSGTPKVKGSGTGCVPIKAPLPKDLRALLQQLRKRK